MFRARTAAYCTYGPVSPFEAERFLEIERDHRIPGELEKEVAQSPDGDFSRDRPLRGGVVFGVPRRHFDECGFDQSVDQVVRFDSQTFASGDFDVRTFGVFDGQFDAEIGAAARRQRHHFV